MNEETKSVVGVLEGNTACPEKPVKGSSRRQFLGQVGVAAGLAAGTLAAPTVSSATQGASSNATTAAAPSGASGRVLEAFELRVSEATTDALLGPAKNVNNGDQAKYADHGGTYSKGLAHDAY
ncbi:MAG: twin-arginine translocation signal domain-containing protein, partial [Candidatus Acidiferrum sp.]